MNVKKNDAYGVPRAAVRACAGVVNLATYAGRVRAASEVVGAGIESAGERERLITAIKLNLSSRREWSYERLRRRYSLSVGESLFFREKRRFVYELSRLCGFI